jgi:drug/metabolite transporter (DMT)-like permease
MRPGRIVEERVSPLAALAVAVLAVSTSAILVRWSEAPSSVKALYRVVFMTALVAPVAVARDRKDLQRIGRLDTVVALATGAALAVHFAAWFESLEFTTVAASVTLVQTQPLFVAAGAALLLGERVTRMTVVGILVAVVGVAVMSAGEAGSQAASAPLLGNTLAVAGAIAAAAYVLAGRSLRQRISLFPYVTVVYAACSVVLLGVVVAQGHDLLAYPLREWLLFLGMAVGPGLFGHTVVNWALEHLESSLVSVSLLGEPVGSTVLALWLLAEVPGPWTVVGGGVVLSGIYLVARARESR